MISPTSPIVRKLSTFVALPADDIELLAGFHRRRRMFEAGRQVIAEGEKRQCAYILAKGWACCFKLLPDGRRQIVDFQIPGDFMGLRSLLFRTSDHSAEAVTDIEASEVMIGDILDAFSKAPRLGTAVLWAASRDEAMAVEHLVNIGRRSAEERLAHFILEMEARLTLVGLADKKGFACPLTQYHLADLLGLTAVHVNRILRLLREKGLAHIQNRRVSIMDRQGLIKLAGFDKAYLDHDGPMLRWS